MATRRIAEWNLRRIPSNMLHPRTVDDALRAFFLADAVEGLTERGVPKTQLLAKLKDVAQLEATWAELRCAALIARNADSDVTIEMETRTPAGTRPDVRLVLPEGPPHTSVEIKSVGLADIELDFMRRMSASLGCRHPAARHGDDPRLPHSKETHPGGQPSSQRQRASKRPAAQRWFLDIPMGFRRRRSWRTGVKPDTSNASRTRSNERHSSCRRLTNAGSHCTGVTADRLSRSFARSTGPPCPLTFRASCLPALSSPSHTGTSTSSSSRFRAAIERTILARFDRK